MENLSHVTPILDFFLRYNRHAVTCTHLTCTALSQVSFDRLFRKASTCERRPGTVTPSLDSLTSRSLAPRELPHAVLLPSLSRQWLSPSAP